MKMYLDLFQFVFVLLYNNIILHLDMEFYILKLM